MKRYIVLCISMSVGLLPSFVCARAPGIGSVVVADHTVVSSTLHKPFTLTLEKQSWTVPKSTLAKWIKIQTDGDATFIKLRPNETYKYFNTVLAPVVNDTGDNARVVFQNGVLTIKAPARNGRIIDGIQTSIAIREAVRTGKSTAVIRMKMYVPPVRSVADAQKLGIHDLLGHGESSFAGSPTNRRKNIGVGRLQFQGILLAPNEEFSFNRFLGPVTKEAGYLPELVIKEHVTTPEFGGGLCQVSTTVFRAAVKSGMDITSRRSHAYPVQYYGTPGFDATVYQPAPDLRFTNITGSWVLIQTSLEGSKLSFDIYGKAHGRTVVVDGPHTIAKQPDGTLRTLLRQTIKDAKGNVVHDELFPSTYKSPDLFPHVRAENGETGKAPAAPVASPLPATH